MKSIILDSVSKKFSLSHNRDTTTSALSYGTPRTGSITEFWALRNIDMKIDKGRVVGVIGRNGSGKTTLLNLIAGITRPTFGEIETEGRVASLLTLGAGFQGELTGRENIYLNGSILGMSRKEVDKKYNRIAAFSELDEFLGFPLQAYSQGMRLRLGFSVAIHAEFDILLIDEILSVGDVAFQNKCFSAINKFRDLGKTMIIASQSLEMIERLCDKSYLLEEGEIVEQGDPQTLEKHYRELLKEGKTVKAFQRRAKKLNWWADKSQWGSKESTDETTITKVTMRDGYNRIKRRFKPGERVTIKADFEVVGRVSEFYFGVAIFREEGVYCYGPNTYFDGHRFSRVTKKGRGFFSITFKPLGLQPGQYRLSVAIWDKSEMWPYDYHIGYYGFEIAGESKHQQLLQLTHKWDGPLFYKGLLVRSPDMPIAVMNQHRKTQDIIATENKFELLSIHLTDIFNTEKPYFSTGEDLKVKLCFNPEEKYSNCVVWVGLFRSDNIYCHGALTKLYSYEPQLVYRRLPLLTGDYYISVAVWEEGQSHILYYKHKATCFKMLFMGEDHGTVYMRHSWQWRLP